MKKINRISDILELTKDLDITPTMFKNATDKYEAIGKYFESIGLHCEIFPLGSFATGTVVRPYRNDKDADYDLDFICLLSKKEGNVKPKEVKYAVYDGLISNENYKRILCDEEYDKCWTLEYADVNAVGFNMDIVPAAHKDFTDEVIVITDKVDDDNYKWINSRPKAYRDWFMAINEPFKQYNREGRRQDILKRFANEAVEVEEIVDSLDRSVMQVVVQLLKRHRDIYFSKAGNQFKVPSVIITTLVARIASTIDSSVDFYDLLNMVVSELSLYENHIKMSQAIFEMNHPNKLLIEKRDGEWWIPNPVNREDNLADTWNDDQKRALLFFKWVKKLLKDFVIDIEDSDEVFMATLGNAFGREFFGRSEISKRYKVEPPKVIDSLPKQYGSERYV